MMGFSVQSRVNSVIARTRQACLEAVTATVESAADDARARCPVRTGELRDSIDGEVQSAGSVITAVLGASADHALPVEFGTERMSAQPFIRPAAERMPEELARQLKARMQ